MRADSGRSAKGEDSGLLPPGVKCRYESGSYGWMETYVKRYNPEDCTYDLNVREHAALDKIAPLSGVQAAEAWPPGTLTVYRSASAGESWLPAVVNSFNVSDGTYNLDVRDHADVDRIRVRVDRPAEEIAGGSSASSRPRRTVIDAPPAVECGVPESPAKGGSALRGGRNSQKTRAFDTEATSAVSHPTAPSRKVGPGDRCMIPEQGLALIHSCWEGNYTVEPERTSGKRQVLLVEDMRAPAEGRYAWAPGTKVSYQSASMGQWIDANVASFNAHNSTYNLDVRQEAAPDKVRPR